MQLNLDQEPGLYRSYEAIKKQRGVKRAIIAVSRKIIIRIRRILLDGITHRTEFAVAA